MKYSPEEIARAILQKGLDRANREWAALVAQWNCEDPMPPWAGPPPVPDPAVDDPRPDAKVIPLYPQPDGTLCACKTFGKGACRIHRDETDREKEMIR